MPENRDSILSLIDIANTLPDVCSSPCIIELQSLIKQSSTGTTFSATSSITSEVLIGNKVSYSRLTATSSETKISDTANEYDTTILTEEEKLKLSLGDESYAGMTYSSIEARTSDGGQTTEIYIKNHDNTYTYDKQITSAADNTDMSDGTSAANRFLTKDSFGVSADNGTDTRSYIQGQVYPGSPDNGSLVMSIDDAAYSQNYDNSISLINQGANDGRILIYQKDETQPYSARIEMKADTKTVEIKSENGALVTPATDVSNIVLTPTNILSKVDDLIGTYSQVELTAGGVTTTSTDGTNTTAVGVTPTGYSITTPTTLYNAQSNGDLEIRADGSLTLYGDYQGYQPLIQLQSNLIQTQISAGGTYSTILLMPDNTNISTTDGDKYGQVSIDKSFISISIDDTAQDQSPSISLFKTFGMGGVPNTSEIIFNTIDNTGNGGEANLSVKSERDAGSSVNIDAEYINNTSNTSIVSTVSDGVGTQSSISMYPDSMDILATDGTTNVSCSVYTSGLQLNSTDGSSFINNISLNTTGAPGISIGSSNPTTSAATAIEFTTDSISLLGLPSFDDDADATAGSLVAGNLYQTTGLGASPLDVAGILMIKQ